MTDILLSSFLSLFALFGKKEQVDEAWAKTMLISFLRHHFGIRNIDTYLGLYDDMRGAYEMMDDDALDTQSIVTSICSELHGKIRQSEATMLLLRLMEFCNYRPGHSDELFQTMAKTFQVSDATFENFVDFVAGKESRDVLVHKLPDTDGTLQTLLSPAGTLLFTYTGNDKVMLNDVPVLAGSFQV
jgi:hypothetical protein